jgi:hypothetical protein
MGAIYNPQPSGNSPTLPWATFEQYGAKGDGTTDDTAALTAALAVRQHILVTPKTFKITSNLIEQFNGRIVQGVDARHSKIFQSTSNQHAVIWQADTAGDPFYGAGIYATSWRDLSILGPGTYSNTSGTFSGSTGDGLHLENGSGTYFGDHHLFQNLYINGFGRQMRINGQGNTSMIHCAFEYGGTGLSIGTGAGNNSIRTTKLITSNLATFNIDVGSGVNVLLGLGDTTVNTAGSCTQLNVQSAASVLVEGGNFEQCTASGNVVINAGSLLMERCYLNRGAGADNIALVNNNVAMLIGGINGFTTPYGGTGLTTIYDFSRLTIPPGGAGGGASSSSPGIVLNSTTLKWFLRTAQIQGDDFAIFSGGNLRLVIDESGKLIVETGKLNLAGIPTSSSGLVTGDVWSNLGILTIV